MDEEDEVVRSFDVFFAEESPENALCLLQFPLRPAWRPYDADQVSSAHLKKKSGKLELAYSIKTPSENTDQEKAGTTEQLLTLVSTQVEPKTHYAIGILNESAFTIASLRQIKQMRPTIKEGRSNQQVARVEEETDTKGMPQQMIEKLYSFKVNQESKDESTKLVVFPRTTPETQAVLYKSLYCNELGAVLGTASHKQFLDSLFPSVQNDDLPEAVRQWAKLPLSRLHHFPLAQQVYSLMVGGISFPYSRIKELVSPTALDGDVLTLLERCAVLVQGVWIVKALPRYRGRLATIREYLLSEFAQTGSVRQLAFLDKLPQELFVYHKSVRQMLEDIAVCVMDESQTLRWTLKSSPDQDFIVKFPEIVQRQRDGWKQRTAAIEYNLKRPETDITTQFATIWWEPPLTTETGPVRTQQKANDPGSAIKATGTFLVQLFGKFGVCAPAFVQKEFARQKLVPDSPLAQAPEPLLQQLMARVAMKFGDALVLKGTNNPELDKWRPHLIKIFEAQSVIPLSDLREKIKELAGEDMPPGAWQKLLPQFARLKEGVFTAKTGLYDPV